MIFRNPVVHTIILINILVFLVWTFQLGISPEFMSENFLVSWDALLDGRYWTLLTSVFSHNLFLHLFINMYVLLSFGSLLEQGLGSWSFLKFYLAAGIVSSLSHCLVSAYIVGDPGLLALGASGAIAGLILVFSLTFPREKILLLGIIPLPSIYGAFAFIALDLWGLFAQAQGGGLPIGHGAHLGGAFTGIIYYLFVIRPRLVRRRLISTPTPPSED